MKSSLMSKVLFVGSLVILGAVAAVYWDLLPREDSQQYLNFADKSIVLGIPHFYDVFSNLFFIYVSFFSLLGLLSQRKKISRALWESALALNLAVFLTGWGSSYFHLFPGKESLIWDRLPMALGFASLVTLVLADRWSERFHRLLFVVLASLALWTVYSIDYGLRDLRPYIITQFGSMAVVALALVFLRFGYLRVGYLWLGFALYATAKITEGLDYQILEMAGVSGHTLKHLLAALAILSLNLAVFTGARPRESKFFS